MYRYFVPVLFILLPALLLAQNLESDAQKTQQLIETGKFADAQQIADRLMRQAETTTDGYALFRLGMAFEDQYRYAEAEPLYKRAVEIYQEKFGKDEQHYTATLMNEWGIFYANQGRYTEAAPLLEQALEIRKKQLGENHDDTVQSLNDLAVLYKNQGYYGKAYLYNDRAIVIVGKQSIDSIKEAVLWNNRGVLYQEQSRFEDAKQAFEVAVRIRERRDGKEHPDIAAPLDNLARLLRDHSSYAHDLMPEERKRWLGEAKEHQDRALTINEKHNGRNHPHTAFSLDGLAAIYYCQERYADSERHFKEALEIYKNKLGENHPHVADTTAGLAKLYAKQRRFDEAKRFYDQAIAIFEKTAMEARIGQIWYRDRALMYKEWERPEEAIRDMKRAMELSLELRLMVSGNAEQRAQTFEHYYGLFERMVDWQYELKDYNEAYEAMERSRAQGLRDLLNSSHVDILTGLAPETAKKLRADEAAALRDIATYKGQIDALSQRTRLTTAQKAAEERRLQDALDAAKERRDEASVAIRSASPAYRQMIDDNRKPVPFETVQKEFSTAKTLALQYLVGREKSYVLVYGCDTEPILLPLELNEKQAESLGIEEGSLTSAKLDFILNDKKEGVLQLVGDPKNTAANENIGKNSLPSPKTLDKLSSLWKLLVPDESICIKILNGENFSRLLILPDSALAQLPFEMLVVDLENANSMYLLDRGPPIVYAPSASLYYYLIRLKVETNTAQKRILTVGDPDYSIPFRQSNTFGETSNAFRTALRGQLTPLPLTAKEVEWVEASGKNNNFAVTPFTRERATVANIRNNMLERTIVHLACHGIVEEISAEERVFRALAVAVDPSNPSDAGFLEFEEMLQLALKSCELAVLSACLTNIGPNQLGEGTWSMGRGMFVSGAKRVVTTNWNVDDIASAHLIRRFIDKVNQSQNPNYAEALRDAKRRIREGKIVLEGDQPQDDRETPEWQHPYYWAPFVLIGPN